MNPGLVVKLRPTGPWRIGPDSGSRNRVDVIYHSDSLYSAVTSAMARLGELESWLEATARSGGEPPVRFSSCFPFLDELGYVIPPRTIWPPTSPAMASVRVRWRSARFVPLGLVQALLAGQIIDDNHWMVDGTSECLIPIGRPGPFRTGVRWNAAVDRLTGSSERHSTACIEFRAGAGLWTIVSFADDAAWERWGGPVRAAFRLLADSGFGGERSRGWGRAESPEFIEGPLPDLILPPAVPAAEPDMAAELTAPAPTEPLTVQPVVEAAPEDEPTYPIEEPEPAAPPEQEPPQPEPPAEEPPPAGSPAEAGERAATEASEAPGTAATPTSQSATQTSSPHWLLSLFAPAATDGVDWTRGNYSVIARTGRIESPAAHGALKKQINMVTEGSVLYASAAPRGAAIDVAPDGFAHPVFRAGFAVAIPLPGEVI